MLEVGKGNKYGIEKMTVWKEVATNLGVDFVDELLVVDAADFVENPAKVRLVDIAFV